QVVGAFVVALGGDRRLPGADADGDRAARPAAAGEREDERDGERHHHEERLEVSLHEMLRSWGWVPVRVEEIHSLSIGRGSARVYRGTHPHEGVIRFAGRNMTWGT